MNHVWRSNERNITRRGSNTYAYLATSRKKGAVGKTARSYCQKIAGYYQRTYDPRYEYDYTTKFKIWYDEILSHLGAALWDMDGMLIAYMERVNLSVTTRHFCAQSSSYQ